jgi:lysophospholipase L1-like esterase
MSLRACVALATFCCFVTPVWAEFELKDGDRVVLLGGTLIEREGQFGYLETALALAYPQRSLVFRNLGWSGDTVWADSRGIFDPPHVGYQRLLELVTELRPTVIILAYGQNESFAGADGLPAFIAQYEKLCDDLSSLNARLIFWTPPRFPAPRGRWPDVRSHNVVLTQYAEAIAELAQRRQAAVVRIDQRYEPTPAGTDAGIHLNERGYDALAQVMLEHIVRPSESTGEVSESQRALLREKIVAKNMLFFHRWRPQNITYLFGFRKHEQGNNAVEIPQFDPLVQAAEAEIEALRR